MAEPLLTMEEVEAAIADRMAKAPLPRERRKAACDKRPTIELRIGETERIVDEIEAALIASDRGLYRRGGLIVATGFDKMQTWDGKTIEVQIIEERDNYALLEDIEAAAGLRQIRRAHQEAEATSPTMRAGAHAQAAAASAAPAEPRRPRQLPDHQGERRTHDRAGLRPRHRHPVRSARRQVPARARQARQGYGARPLWRGSCRLVETFDFVSKDDKAVALSLILTAIARPGLPTAPLHGFDAPVAGSGKSKLVDIASILATGHEAGVTAQGETREEAEKRLSTLLMRGDPIIALDNCEGPLEGVVFNQALTQQWANLRILGLSKAVRTRCASLITATGNNLVIKGDLTRRAVVCRLDPKVERPELRQYAYDPIADAKDNRGELVAAALTILRAYHVAGRPNRPPRLQSFEQWSDTVRGALMWLGAGDPAGTMDRLRKADPVLASLTAVLHAWRDAFGFEPTTAREAIEAADDRRRSARRADGGRRTRRKDRRPRPRQLARPSRRRPRRQSLGESRAATRRHGGLRPEARRRPVGSDRQMSARGLVGSVGFVGHSNPE